MPSSRRKEIHNFVLSAIDPKIAAGFILHLQPHSSPNLKKFALGDGKGWDRWGEGSSEDISRTDRPKRFLPGVFKQTGLSQLFCKLPRQQIWELKGFLEGDEMLHFWEDATHIPHWQANCTLPLIYKSKPRRECVIVTCQDPTHFILQTPPAISLE